MIDFLKSLFADKLVDDDREPILTWKSHDETYGLLAPKLALWYQLQLVVLLQTVLQCAFAVVIYKFIVQKRGQSSTYLLGYGVLMPLALYLPFELLEVLDIQNKIMRLAFTTLPCIVCFRTFEALYGTSPAVVESSLTTYVIYYTTLMHFEWDPKTKTRRRITGRELRASVSKVLFHSVLLSLLLSYEQAYHYQPFGSSVDLAEFDLSWDLLSWRHLANTYLLGVLTYLTLCFGFELTAVSENVKGAYTKTIFHNPLISARTPSQFWGQKWNLMIHRILKHGAFLPAVQFVSTRLAIAVTFFASGLLHEYSWKVVFYHHTSTRDEATGVCEDCFTPYPYKLTAFFLWNGVILLLERPLAPLFDFMRSWPTPLVCTLLMLTALPISHWYTGDWALGGYFDDLSIGLFIIRKLSSID